jgi:GDP-L-fucose synthase
VIPALIRKMVEAKRSGMSEVVCWGDGTPTREFLYVEDCADALVLAAERYNGGDPVNLGSGEEIAIRDLVEMVADMVGYRGRIQWDLSRPNGQPRRKLDITRAARSFGFSARTGLRDGLHRTVAWYLEAMPEAVPA